ncbi:MAG TPA: hypothetical protein VF407_04815, partial [Polyangiaceae bacterium]
PKSSAAFRVLVVVDDDEPAAMLDLAAADIDAVVRREATTQGALRALAEFRADVVVADLAIRDLATNLDFLALLYALVYRPMPVGIAIGDGSAMLDGKRALESKYHAFLRKPLTTHGMRDAFRMASKIAMRRSHVRSKGKKTDDA